MESLVGYCLGQFKHHGLAEDPALATGSCFPDLIGARRLPGLTLQLATALPRFRLGDACEAVGLGDDLAPADDAELRRRGAARLAAAVAETLAVVGSLSGNTAGVAEARSPPGGGGGPPGRAETRGVGGGGGGPRGAATRPAAREPAPAPHLVFQGVEAHDSPTLVARSGR